MYMLLFNFFFDQFNFYFPLSQIHFHNLSQRKKKSNWFENFKAKK